jgi:hypothetical protein
VIAQVKISCSYEAAQEAAKQQRFCKGKKNNFQDQESVSYTTGAFFCISFILLFIEAES